MAHRYFVDAHSFFQGVFDVFLWPLKIPLQH
jgi:hypothetical protein